MRLAFYSFFRESLGIPDTDDEGFMHQGNTEKELMEWFDKQATDTKWRISAYVSSSGRPMPETLLDLKRVSEAGKGLQLIHPGSRQRH